MTCNTCGGTGLIWMCSWLLAEAAHCHICLGTGDATTGYRLRAMRWLRERQ